MNDKISYKVITWYCYGLVVSKHFTMDFPLADSIIKSIKASKRYDKESDSICVEYLLLDEQEVNRFGLDQHPIDIDAQIEGFGVEI